VSVGDGRKYSLRMRSGIVPTLWSLLLVLMLAPVPSAQISTPLDDGALATARHLFREADFRGAAAAYRKSLEGRVSDEAYSGLIRSLLKADDVIAAEESSRKALAALPDSAMIHAAA
jgi:hypothetical protein